MPIEISLVLATHNRREVVVQSLQNIPRDDLKSEAVEVIVVDNQSTDGTVDVIRNLADVLIPLRSNLGSCGKALGVDHARGKFVVFLDDDSIPKPGSLSRMVERFGENPRLGAAGFTVHLPNGDREGAALPGVFVGCGVGFRADALRAVGGLDRTFFMQAEEYDLCFRLASAGWDADVFDDLHVVHLKTDKARRSERTTYYDVRNNLRVLGRYVPRPHYRAMREDVIERYRFLSENADHGEAFDRGIADGKRLAWSERRTHRRFRLTPEAFEKFFKWKALEARMRRLRSTGVRRVLLADLGKHILGFHRAAAATGLQIAAIADDGFARAGRTYRGIEILTVQEAIIRSFDAIVVSNLASVHAARTRYRLQALGVGPAHDWYGERTGNAENEGDAGMDSPAPITATDDTHAAIGAFPTL